MKPWDEDCLHLGFDDSEQFDPLMASGSLPLTEVDICSIRTLCEAATPGPLLIDDQTTGEGAVVATLPDGRHIVSLAPDASSDDPATVEANARLIRQARCLLLRLLRERDRWQLERSELLARLRAWESQNRPARSARRVVSIPR